MTNEGTSQTRNSTSKEQGQYAFANVPPGVYFVSATVDGFKPFAHAGIEVGVQRFVILDIVLGMGTVEERITVSCESPLLETATNAAARFASHEGQMFPDGKRQEDARLLADAAHELGSDFVWRAGQELGPLPFGRWGEAYRLETRCLSAMSAEGQSEVREPDRRHRYLLRGHDREHGVLMPVCTVMTAGSDTSTIRSSLFPSSLETRIVPSSTGSGTIAAEARSQSTRPASRLPTYPCGCRRPRGVPRG